MQFFDTHAHIGLIYDDPIEQFRVIQQAKQAGVNRFAIVTSGRALGGAEFDQAIKTYEKMNATLKIDLCASHGILNRDQFRRLRAAGVTSYHHNIETSRRYFPQICTTHTYEDRIKTIRLAQSEGLNVCSGGIIGMGETWEDRIDMAFSLAELNIQSIPINALMDQCADGDKRHRTGKPACPARRRHSAYHCHLPSD